MDFKLDKIGVYFYNSRGASVGFNTSRAIPWDLLSMLISKFFVEKISP